MLLIYSVSPFGGGNVSFLPKKCETGGMLGFPKGKSKGDFPRWLTLWLGSRGEPLVKGFYMALPYNYDSYMD